MMSIPEQNPVVRLFTRFMPVTTAYHAEKFFVRLNGRWFATPLFMVLLMVEVTDVVFALDSIPAVLAVTTDPFIVYTSNVFAILGLRSLFFALSGLMGLFHYLRYGFSRRAGFYWCQNAASRGMPHPRPLGSCRCGWGVLLLSVLASLIYPVPEANVPTTDDFPREA